MPTETAVLTTTDRVRLPKQDVEHNRQKCLKGTSGPSAGVTSSSALALSGIPPKVDEVINRTLPTGPGQRVNRLWEFARRLKGIPGLDTSPAALSGYLREWHRRALPCIETKQFEATEQDFCNSWKNARIPLTDGRLADRLRPALEGPTPKWLRDMSLPQAGKKLLVACAVLQQWAGDKPFSLGAKVAASVIGADQNYTCRLFKQLVSAGHLVRVKKGSPESKTVTTWRYKGPPMRQQ